MAWNVALALVATFAGVIDSLRGKTYQTWAPAKSRD
jgi:flagellar motor component MotA